MQGRGNGSKTGAAQDPESEMRELMGRDLEAGITSRTD